MLLNLHSWKKHVRKPYINLYSMATFEFLTSDHNWTFSGRKKLDNIRYSKLPHKRLYRPTMLKSFIDYVDFDVYKKLRDDFQKGRFYYLANNDEYAYMFLFDLMNGYPENAMDIDFVKLDDELYTLRQLSEEVDGFFKDYINNAEYKAYLKADKLNMPKDGIKRDPRSFRFPMQDAIEYEPIDKNVLPRNHEWKMADDSKPLELEREAEPLFLQNASEIKKKNSFEKIVKEMDNFDWKKYLAIRSAFQRGEYKDLTYQPLTALHLMYDFMGGQDIADGTDDNKLYNELWVIEQCSNIKVWS